MVAFWARVCLPLAMGSRLDTLGHRAAVRGVRVGGFHVGLTFSSPHDLPCRAPFPALPSVPPVPYASLSVRPLWVWFRRHVSRPLGLCRLRASVPSVSSLSFGCGYLLRFWRLFEASHLEGFREFEDRVGWCLTDRDRGWISCGRRFSATSDWIGLWMGSCDRLSAFRQRIGSSNGAGNFDGRVATALSAARG